MEECWIRHRDEKTVRATFFRTLLFVLLVHGFFLAAIPSVWDPPKNFIVSGPYCYVRNPMYLGMFGLLVGEAVFLESWVLLLYGGIATLSFHIFVIVYEEPALRRRFGTAYEEYCREVLRWRPRLAGSMVLEGD